MRTDRYVLITAARNEDAYIRNVLESIVAQTCLPDMWLIVSDGSTDRTDELVRDFAKCHHFIRLLRLEDGRQRSFSSKALVLNAGYDEIRDREFDFIGFVDADVSLPANYYERLLNQFEADARLGLAGGAIVEQNGGEWALRSGDSLVDVGGQMQLFRRRCYEDVGSFEPLQWGGEDTVANLRARAKGWKAVVFRTLRVRHHRRTGTAGATVYRARFRNGMCDYYMGYHPLFEFAKCIRRIAEPPYAIGSILRIGGYIRPALTGQRPAMPADFVKYLRSYQLKKLLRVGGEV